MKTSDYNIKKAAQNVAGNLHNYDINKAANDIAKRDKSNKQ